MTKRALILGVSGQDGAYLSQLLLEKGYAVHGTSRDPAHPLPRHRVLGIAHRVTMHALSLREAGELGALIADVAPDEVYNLSGLSSVAQSFADPATARESIVGTQVRLLEILRGTRTRVYHSASSECFGDAPRGIACDEETPFAPRSPYAEAKVEAHRATAEARERHGLFAVSGIMFNHESPLRGETFVTKKIIAAAATGARLTLGDMSVSRDWGYAPEYVEAMWLMLQQDEPRDYVIATGESHTVEELASAAFAEFGRDYRDFIEIDRSLFRPNELHASRGNPSRAARELGWTARTKFAELVRLLALDCRVRSGKNSHP